MMRRGFTIVELLITLILMVVLLTLGVAGMRQLQENARDEERKSDVESIALGLEQYYKLGNPLATSTANDAKKGSYPSTNEILHMKGTSRSNFSPTQISRGYLTEAIPGTSSASFESPTTANALENVCVFACAAAGTPSQISSMFASKTDGVYIYEPVKSDGTICYSGDCVKYNIYWISETDSTAYKGIPGLKVRKSKNQ